MTGVRIHPLQVGGDGFDVVVAVVDVPDSFGCGGSDTDGFASEWFPGPVGGALEGEPGIGAYVANVDAFGVGDGWELGW